MIKSITRTTIVMACRNNAHFLYQSLGGILNQKNRPLKVIFIDDASIDGSLEVAKRILEGCPGVQFISHRKSLGVTASLNEGLSRVDTPFVAFAAADNQLYANFLEKSENALVNFPEAALVTSGTDVINLDGRYIGHRPSFPPSFKNSFLNPEKVKKLMEECDNFLVSNVALYRTKCLREINGFDENLQTFCDGIVMRLLALRYGFVFLKDTLGSWRLHGTINPDTIRYAEDVTNQISRYIIREQVEHYFPINYKKKLLSRLKFGLTRSFLDSRQYSVCRNSKSALENFWLYRILSGIPSRSLRSFLSHLILYCKYRPCTNRALLRLGRNSIERKLVRYMGFK